MSAHYHKSINLHPLIQQKQEEEGFYRHRALKLLKRATTAVANAVEAADGGSRGALVVYSNSQSQQPITAMQLIGFAEDLNVLCMQFIEDESYENARVCATRAELLMRNPQNSRRRFTDEDWLVLAAVPRSDGEAHRSEARRNKVHCESLQHLAFVLRCLEQYEDARLALLEAISIVPEVQPQTLLNLASILSCIPERRQEFSGLIYEIISTLKKDFEMLQLPEVSKIIVSGTVTQREEYAKHRELVAAMLVTAELYHLDLVEDTMRTIYLLTTMIPYVRILQINQIIVQYAQLTKFCNEELPQHHEVTQRLLVKKQHCSQWLGMSRYASPQEMLMTDDSARWNFQCRRAKQFQLLHGFNFSAVMMENNVESNKKKEENEEGEAQDEEVIEDGAQEGNADEEEEAVSSHRQALAELASQFPFYSGVVLVASIKYAPLTTSLRPSRSVSGQHQSEEATTQSAYRSLAKFGSREPEPVAASNTIAAAVDNNSSVVDEGGISTPLRGETVDLRQENRSESTEDVDPNPVAPQPVKLVESLDSSPANQATPQRTTSEKNSSSPVFHGIVTMPFAVNKLSSPSPSRPTVDATTKNEEKEMGPIAIQEKKKDDEEDREAVRRNQQHSPSPRPPYVPSAVMTKQQMSIPTKAPMPQTTIAVCRKTPKKSVEETKPKPRPQL